MSPKAWRLEWKRKAPAALKFATGQAEAFQQP
jgi:hypothetical protein